MSELDTTDNESEFFRPPSRDVHAAWTKLFSDPFLSLSGLKAEGSSLGPEGADGGVILRSVYWRFYLGLLPPPTSPDLFPPHLAAKRRAYNELREQFLIAPDGRWASDCSGGEGYCPSSPKTNMSGGWDPLSLDGGSPWKTWFAHLELRATIRQDVDRTFPDIPYFKIECVRRSLVTMLFLFSVLNPDVGYRQGMHELLAVCMLVVDRDSLEPALSDDPALTATLDRTYVEHDAFGMFEQIMRPAKSFYEWRAEECPPVRGAAPQAPVIIRCNTINNQLIRRIDPQLWERFETEGVEAQIWAIRWLRLLLTRELPFPEALRLWDGMFAEDPSLAILDYVCVAMLLLIRNELIEADYPVMLTHLLHYPAPTDSYPFKPALIIAQAKHLRDNVSPAGGIEVVLQNQELLGIKASGSDKPLIESEPTTPGFFFGRASPSQRPNSAPRAPKAKVGVQGLAQGLFERAQKSGIDKAFISTVTDFRNSLPDSATFFSPPPSSRESSPFSSIPSTSALPARPVPQPQLSDSSSVRTLLDAERQMAEVRLAMLGMGKAMAEWLDLLHGTGTADATEEEVQSAWQGLERVRDGLIEAAATDVDDLVKDWAFHDGLDTSRSRSTAATPVDTMLPVPSTPPPRTSSLGKSQTTPKAFTREGSPTPPKLHQPPPPKATAPASPKPTEHTPQLPSEPVSPEGIQLHLSTRGDRPAAALPRIPLHHPTPSHSTSPTGASVRRLSANAAALPKPPTVTKAPSPPGASPPKPAAEVQSGPVDPLAGVGVGLMRSSSTAREEKRRSTFRHASGSQSTIAVGADPLGASR